MSNNGGSASNSPANKNSLSPGSGSVPRFRASLDANKTLSGANYGGGQMSAGIGGGFGGLPTPGLGQTRLRPSSDMLMNPGSASHTPEAEAIDKWFEDLQHYEATLEEMAAASLDQNFKEELSAIEQWFRVLSEAERTAALYSLLQSSTQLQIRFFITVLQQMARADPMSALLSPANPQNASMESQMEAKMANLGLKPPNSAAGTRSFSRQSLGAPGSEFLSPNSAALHDGSDPASRLAQERAKLKAGSHRISAPGTLHGGSSNSDAHKSPLWSQANSDQVAETGLPRSPSPNPNRPKSTSSDAGTTVTLPRQPAFGDQFTPLVGGNWASMSNTPLVAMFGNKNENGEVDAPGFSGTQPNLDAASNKLSNWSGGQLASSAHGGSNFLLDDARKFRRNEKVGSGGDSDVQGVLSGMYKDNRRSSNNPDRSTSPAPPGMLNSQQAAVAAQQNWRNGLNTPNSAASGTSSDQMNVIAMANLFNMQQQQLQLQQNILALSGGLPNAMSMGMGMQSPLAVAGGMGNMGMLQNQMLSPGMGMGGMGVGMGNLGAGGGMGMAGSINQQRRSPRANERTPANKSHPPPVAGSGSNPEEAIDLTLLSDVSAWLRSLRLHKYTTNFETTKWQDMVMMDEAALEAKGVSALGARRKMLKVFETVREKMGMQLPGDGAGGEGDSAAATS